MHCSRRLIVQILVVSHSYLHRQVSPPETLVMKGGTTWARNGRWILPENARLPRNIQGSFTYRKSTTWDKRLYFPSEGRCAEDFFALKNPTASAGFEPANLVTKGQHATSRPPKPQLTVIPNGGSELSCIHYIQFTRRLLIVRSKYDARTVNSTERCVRTAVLCNTYTFTAVADCWHTNFSDTSLQHPCYISLYVV